MAEHRLWYERPAGEWTEALPLGNGNLGAMIFGKPGRELIQLNDSTAWSGTPANERHGKVVQPNAAADALAMARAAVAAGDYAGAESQVKRFQHRYSQSYLPFADLTVQFGSDRDVTNYRRELNLATATHTVEYLLAGQAIRAEQFISHRHGALIIELSSEDPNGVELALEINSQLKVLDRRSGESLSAVLLNMPSDVAPNHEPTIAGATWSEDLTASMQGAVAMVWNHDGESSGGMARGVRRATIAIATQTTFAGIGRQPVGTAEDALQAARERAEFALANAVIARQFHEGDHHELYGRASITTGDEKALPTDRRLVEANASDDILSHDPGLAGLLFNYGRYLLIASSRQGGVPANLQGVWNNLLQPPWSSNYTTNINVEMNYWPAEVGNLAECAEPYYELVEALARNGQETARRLYDAPGWVTHHNTDIWAYTQPVGLGLADPKWAFWPLAPAWLVRQLWEHIQFGAEHPFARERAWPVVRSAAEFMLAWLVEQSDGTLGTSPSTSPENLFSVDGAPHAVAASSTLDLVLISDTLTMLADIAQCIGEADDHVVLAAQSALERIPGPFVGRNGLVAEWQGDFEHPDPTHRHLSNLYFLHPSERPVSPELAEAAARTLDSRGDESTGWSLVWKIAMRARLHQPSKVADLLRLVFRDMNTDRGEWVGGLYPNLLASHPPFQIDGNFGYVAGLAEAILQSHRGEIELLPAVPKSIPSGAVQGLIARPGIEVSLSWVTEYGTDPELKAVTLCAVRPAGVGPRRVVYRGNVLMLTLQMEAPVVLGPADWESEDKP